jgi:hypothetical protein
MPLRGADYCWNCPNNSVIVNSGTGSSSILDCVCSPGYYTPYGEPGNVCYDCPEGAVCKGGLTQPYPRQGFWEVEGHRHKRVFVQCRPAALCLTGGYCAAGYRGNLCGDCVEGYYRRGIRCRSCSTGIKLSEGWAITLVLTLLTLFCIGLYFIASAEALKRSATVYVMLYFLQVSLPPPLMAA